MAFRPVYSSKLTDLQIRDEFIRQRYSHQASCKKCLSQKIIWITQREYRCRACWTVGSFTTETFLQRSKIPLRIWYELIYCFAVTHTARKAGKLLGLDAVLCWKVYQTIREALVQNSSEYKEQITGTIELDESFYGGTFKNLRKKVKAEFRRLGLNKRGGGAKYRKQPIFGIFKRNGKVFLELIPEAKVLLPINRNRIKMGSDVFSDTGTWYTGLVGLGYVHRTVDHGKEEYVNGEVHINGLEGFWGLSKTNMHTYKGIKKKNWVLYIKEMVFRYNYRALSFDQMGEKIIALLMAYKKGNLVPY